MRRVMTRGRYNYGSVQESEDKNANMAMDVPIEEDDEQEPAEAWDDIHGQELWTCVATFLDPKNAPFRDHENSFTGHVPMLYEKQRKLRNLTDIVFVRQDEKKGPRSTMALDRGWFFQVTAEVQRMSIDNSAFEFADSAFLFI